MEINAQEPPVAAPPIGEPGAGDIQRNLEEADVKDKIRSGEQFIEALSRSEEKRLEEKDKANGSEGEETRETRTDRDMAALSRESVYYSLSKEELSDLDKIWGMEKADLAWKDILEWSPSDSKSFSLELDSLAAIYRELLLAILEHTTAGVQQDQLAALETALSASLMKMLETRMGELGLFLGTFGSQSSMTAIKAALYRSVTGNSLSGNELERVFKGQPEMNRDLAALNPIGVRMPVSESGAGRELGMIYQPAGEGRIKNDPLYAQRMRKEAPVSTLEGSGFPGTRESKIYGAQSFLSSMENKTVYSPADLELAEGFAKYMNSKGNLFRSTGLSGGSGQLYGFLAAVMAIKSQSYGAYSGINKGLAVDLREAVDRMIDLYIQDASRQCEMAGKGPGSKPPHFQPRAAYKVYYYMMNLYQVSRDIGETSNRGIRQAYQQFLKERECLEGRDASSSFFTKEKKDPKEDWKEGKRLVEQDWREFLSFMGREDLGRLPQGLMELSPWGMLAEPEQLPKRGERTSPLLFLTGAAAVIFILILFLSFL